MSTPSYVINFDELVDLLSEYLRNGINVNVGDVVVDTSQLQALLEEINNKIPEGIDLSELLQVLKDLNIFVEDIGNKLGIDGEQRVYGEMLEIPAMKGKYKIEFKPEKDGFITGIAYSQSAWNYEDNWCLDVNDKRIFSNIYTKEYGENKRFSNIYPIKEGETVYFIYNNNSSSNKVVWVDFEILEKEEVMEQ